MNLMSEPKNVLDENRRLREALESILESMEQMPQLNEAIVEEIMRGDHTLECEIGGDEANISSWVAIARMALSPNDRTERPALEGKHDKDEG
jgi:hypothetical protein